MLGKDFLRHRGLRQYSWGTGLHFGDGRTSIEYGLKIMWFFQLFLNRDLSELSARLTLTLLSSKEQVCGSVSPGQAQRACFVANAFSDIRQDSSHSDHSIPVSEHEGVRIGGPKVPRLPESCVNNLQSPTSYEARPSHC